MLVWQRLTEDLVVDAEVVAADTRLRDTCRANRLEDEDRLALQTTRQPALHRPAPQPLVLELAAGIPPQFGSVVEPERRSGGGVEMPVDDLADPRVERGAGGLHLVGSS